MPTPLRSGLDRIIAYFKGFSAAQRTIAIILVAVLGLGGVLAASWLGKTQYSPLFSGLSDTDASAIVDVLKTDGVPYELTDGGNTILVPSDKVYTERLNAAAKNLPADSSSNSGYSLLDKMSVTSSSFQETTTYKRAIEGELQSTIQAMQGIVLAKVQLAIPEQSVFTDDTQAPTASVFVQTSQGTTLSASQVAAITHLVASSITGMTTADVSVVDSQGDTLSADGVASGGSDGSDIEDSTKAAVQKIVDSVVGPGNSTVAVTADVSTDSSTITKETYTPIKDAVPLTESTQSETYGGSSSSSATGTLTTATSTGTPTSSPTGSGYVSQSSTKTNAMDKTTENTTVPTGQLSRLSVSVAVSKKAAAKVDMTKLRQLVQAAAGYDKARGDTVAVQTVAFTTATASGAKAALAQAQKEESAQSTQELIHTGVIGGIVVLVALILVGGLLMLVRRPKREAVDLAELELHEMIADAAAGDGPAAPADAVSAILGTPAAAAAPGAAAPASAGDTPAARRAELDRIARQDPRQAAQTIRALMDERR